MKANERILVVEDNDALRAGLVMNLENRGYLVDAARDGSEGLQKAIDTRPDLIILDLMLPGRNGLEIVSELRRRRRDVPVLILSARDRTEDKVEGLESGADDYLAKPFDLTELLARVKAMLRRRSPRHEVPVATIGTIEIDPAQRRVLVGGREVPLSTREFDVLCVLAEAPGRPRTRGEILERLWGWDYEGSPRTVDNFIVSLRQKIEKDPARPCHILTVRGLGYKLAG